MRATFRTLAHTAALGVMGASTGVALAAVPLPPVHDAGAVAYLSGGIGQGEVHAIETAEEQWPLTLEFAQKDGHHGDFVADVHVVVRDARGRLALTATSDGPFLLARLAPGRYLVDATLDGKTMHDKVTVRSGVPAKAILVWPAGTDNS